MSDARMIFGGSDHIPCPVCGEVLRRLDLGAYECHGCGKHFSPSFLDGYWTRDREEQEKRCDGCKHLLPANWKTAEGYQKHYAFEPWCEVISAEMLEWSVECEDLWCEPPAGFGCRRWEARAAS